MRTKRVKLSLPYQFLFVVTIALLVTISASSCGNQSKPEDTKKTADEHNDAKFSDSLQADATFVASAAEINMEEIQLGQLAQNKAITADVKELGKMLETDHNGALKDLQALAAKKQISVPASLTNEGQETYKKFSALAPKDFDKQYCDLMVKGHTAAIEKFEKASTECKDADVKAWASSMLPGLRAHLDHAMTCQKKFEKM